MNRQSAQPVRDAALAALSQRDACDPAVLLHSGRFHPRWATRSLLARPRAWYRYSAGMSDLRPSSADFPTPALTHNLWTDLRTLLADPRLPGLWFGYFSYDLCRLIEPGKLAQRDADWPLVELAWCPQVEELRISDGGSRNEEDSAIRNPQAASRDLKSNFTRGEYEAAVGHILDYIAAGDVFQVNLAQQFTAEFTGAPRDLYQRLAEVSPAWYGAYLELPGGRAICSTSPELFLQLKGRHVITRPIKGTRPASGDPQDLRCSPKDTAELNMIIDLMRNDLGRVCSYGSVRVTEPRTVESHPTVHHGVATIEGDLHESKDVIDLLKATLPGGSVTGAPKVRAMQIIDELEPHPRGPYCGAIGYISNDELHLSIAIRTMLLKPQASGLKPLYSVDFSVGSGIVADSNPAAEYDETLAKAQAMLSALAG